MKRSCKGEAARSFLEWIRSEERVSGEKPDFGALRRPEKDELRERLLAEQGFLCAYCGRSLASDFSDSHVDHFWPQSVFDGEVHPDDRRLEHSNLFQSCGPGSLPGMRERFPYRTCGDAKGDWFDEEQFVMPSEENCEERFVYDGAGQISAKEASDTAACNMIRVLRLGHGSLNYQRKRVIQDVERELFSAGMDWRDVEREIASLKETDERGRMTGFAQVARRYLEEEQAAGLLESAV